MWAFLRIILLIPIGVTASVLGAVAVYLGSFGFFETESWVGPGGDITAIFGPLVIVLYDITRFAVLPFLGGILVAEMLGLRSMLIWTLFGGAIGLAMHLSAYGSDYSVLPPVAAGLVAGFIYWMIAGHLAGTGFRASRPTSPAPE
jgi:hypothetical protein